MILLDSHYLHSKSPHLLDKFGGNFSHLESACTKHFYHGVVLLDTKEYACKEKESAKHEGPKGDADHTGNLDA